MKLNEVLMQTEYYLQSKSGEKILEEHNSCFADVYGMYILNVLAVSHSIAPQYLTSSSLVTLACCLSRGAVRW